MLGLIFALPIEMAPLKAKLVEAQHAVPLLPKEGSFGSPDPKEFYPGYLEGTPVVLAAAGIGPERAERATKRLISASGGFRVKAVLSVGLAGALREGVKTGELVIARNVVGAYCHASGSRQRTTLELPLDPPQAGFAVANNTPLPCHPFLTELSRKVAEENGFKSHLGDILTVAEPIKRPQDKRLAGRSTGATAVDMEGAGVAVAASEARIPFMALKVILDEVDEELKGTGLVDGEGRVNLFKAFTYLLCRPWDIIHLYRLNRQVELATSELARFLPVMARRFNESGGLD